MSKHVQPQLTGWKEHPKYPLLYCNKNGNTRLWACWVIDDTVYRTDGLINGKLKEPQTHKYAGNTIRSGKEQAPLEAEKMWLKQFDHDYMPAKDDKIGQKVYAHVKQQKEQNGGMNRGVKLFAETEITASTTAGKKDLNIQHRPMLAKKYKNEDLVLSNPGKAIKFPAIIQAKVDGIRALPQLKDGQIYLESRNGNNFVHLNHLRKEIKRWLIKKKCTDLILDGEMYVHRLYRDRDGNLTTDYRRLSKKAEQSVFGPLLDCPYGFPDRAKLGASSARSRPKAVSKGGELTGVERYQFISEACKITRTKAHVGEEMVEYWIFDIWDPTKTNIERHKLLEKIFEDYDGDIIKLVPTRIVNSHEEIEDYMSEMIGENEGREGYEFEGVMVRQASAKYSASTTHSSNLLKYKRFEDDEWEICGAERCDGGFQDGGIKWLCQKMVNGKKCKLTAKQMGNSKDSCKLYQAFQKNPKKFIGRMINVRFNEKTRDGVPRFPRATSFVNDK
jgi:ATP-dependent DNA ligase